MDNTQDERLLIPAMSPYVVDFLDDLGHEFGSRDYEVTFLPQHEDVVKYARTHSEHFDAYRPGILRHDPDRPPEELTKKYDIPSSRSFVFAQMIYDYEHSSPPAKDSRGRGTGYPAVSSRRGPDSFGPYNEWLHICLNFFDQLFESGNGGHPVQFQGGEIIRRSLQRVADYHGYDSVWMGFSPIPGKSGFYTDESSRWTALGNVSYNDLAQEDVERAKSYISDVRADKPVVSNGNERGEPSISRTIAGGIKHLLSEGLDEWPHVRWQSGRKTRRKLMAKYAKYRYLSVEESAAMIRESDYIFYPLQYYIESRVAMRAPAFYEQSWLIEYLSRSVPTGHELFVKDHPQQLGAQPRQAVDTIAEYSVPLAPSLNAHRVIQNASAVVTLNNTVGYEALMYGKPVVTLGDAFYDDYTVSVGDINELDSAIHQAIEQGGLTEKEVVEFTHGLLEGSKAGTWRDTSDENIENVVDGYLSTLHSDS